MTRILISLVSAGLAFVFVFPFYNVAVIAFSDPFELIKGYPILYPSVFSLKNFEDVFSSTVLLKAAFISVSRTVIGLTFSTMMTGVLGYCLSLNKLPGKKAFINIFLFTMFFNGGLIPFYMVIRSLHLLNNIFVYILPYTINVFFMLIMKSYFITLPDSLEEAATLDGCNDIRIFFSIIFPISMPVFAAIGIYNAVLQWNMWWDNYIYANVPELMTLQMLLVKLIRQASMTAMQMGSAFVDETSSHPMGIKMSTTILVIVPIICVYPFFQKYFTKGILVGAVKG